jgi:hypothetical protein
VRFVFLFRLLMSLYFNSGVSEGSPPSGEASGLHPYLIHDLTVTEPKRLLLLCKVSSSTAITLRMTKINACPDFVFTIKDFLILITMTSSRWSALSGRMTTLKPSATLLLIFFSKDVIAGAKTHSNLSGLHRGHTHPDIRRHHPATSLQRLWYR